MLEQVMDDRAQRRFGCKFCGDGETAIQRKAGANKRREFLREKQNVFLRDALRKEPRKETRTRSLKGRLLNGNGNQAHALEPISSGSCVDGIDLAFRERSLRVHGFVTERSHQTSCVTRNTSSGVVMPANTLLQPSCLRARIPERTASALSTVESAVVTINRRISSSTSSSSKI